MKKIGFIGLGAMGYPMARNLLNTGYELYVCDVNPEAMQALSGEGAQIVNLPREIAGISDVVITMLPDSPDVEAVYLGEHGLLSGAHDGLVLIDSSTIDPEVTRRIGREASALGVGMLDAPVGGNVTTAGQGNLIMLVGGEASLVDRCRHILETLGERIIHAGPLGAGESLKLANNLMTGIYACLLAEGLTFAREAGVEEEKLFDLLRGNLPRLFEMLSTRMVEKNFLPGFKTRFMDKDLRLALGLGKSSDTPLPFASLAKRMFRLRIDRELGEDDFASVLGNYEDERIRRLLSEYMAL